MTKKEFTYAATRRARVRIRKKGRHPFLTGVAVLSFPWNVNVPHHRYFVMLDEPYVLIEGRHTSKVEEIEIDAPLYRVLYEGMDYKFKDVEYVNEG